MTSLINPVNIGFSNTDPVRAPGNHTWPEIKEIAFAIIKSKTPSENNLTAKEIGLLFSSEYNIKIRLGTIQAYIREFRELGKIINANTESRPNWQIAPVDFAPDPVHKKKRKPDFSPAAAPAPVRAPSPVRAPGNYTWLKMKETAFEIIKDNTQSNINLTAYKIRSLFYSKYNIIIRLGTIQAYIREFRELGKVINANTESRPNWQIAPVDFAPDPVHIKKRIPDSSLAAAPAIILKDAPVLAPDSAPGFSLLPLDEALDMAPKYQTWLLPDKALLDSLPPAMQ